MFPARQSQFKSEHSAAALASPSLSQYTLEDFKRKQR